MASDGLSWVEIGGEWRDGGVEGGWIWSDWVELRSEGQGGTACGCLPGGTGCYSATLPGPLVQNGDPGCYKGCYKVQHRVLHAEFTFPPLSSEAVLLMCAPCLRRS